MLNAQVPRPSNGDFCYVIDGYQLKGTSNPTGKTLQCLGEHCVQLQILISEVTRPGVEGRLNLDNIRKGFGKPGPGIAYERYDLDSPLLVSDEFNDFQSWWMNNNASKLEGPVWTAMVEWKPGVEAFIPHRTLMKIFDLLFELRNDQI